MTNVGRTTEHGRPRPDSRVAKYCQPIGLDATLVCVGELLLCRNDVGLGREEARADFQNKYFMGTGAVRF